MVEQGDKPTLAQLADRIEALQNLHALANMSDDEVFEAQAERFG